MIRKWPLLPTLLVAAAVATMIGLGVWQLQRRAEKEALIALYRANLARPAIAFPPLGPVQRDSMFRRSSVHCLEVVGWRTELGAAADGAPGYRQIAQCRTGAEGPGALIDMGVAAAAPSALDPKFRSPWRGGVARGTIATEPDHNSLIARLLGRSDVLLPMLVSSEAAPGLQPSARPSPDSVPNNHAWYALQWFLFAGFAALIYVLALKRRERDGVPKNG
jgi:cytochrome oxidase assembly protein ShyY1